ncbi:MAG: gamma-glutamylcyclotransferase [Burkholderiales bacterium]
MSSSKTDVTHLHAATRRALETDDAHARVRGTPLEKELLSDEALETSLQRALASPHHAGDLWLFAYGSLIWNPAIEHAERAPATVHGYHRRFCLRSRLNRGTPERPGLVLALERGGACCGVAYRIPAPIVERELRLLWRREMMLGSYVPHWLQVKANGVSLRALGFVINHQASGYAGSMADADIVEVLARSEGRFGKGLDYLRATLNGLRASGIRDQRLERLDALATQRGY